MTSPRSAARPATPGRRAIPGSVRHSVTLLAAVALAGVVLLAVTDGVEAAALGVAGFTTVGLLVARYAAAGARDGGYRRSIRLLDSSEPVLGGWEWLVHNALGSDGDAYFTERLRPQLQRLFAARLGARHSVDLYRAPQRARTLVGPELWPWIDPLKPPPAPAIPEAALRALLDRLDALDRVDGVDGVDGLNGLNGLDGLDGLDGPIVPGAAADSGAATTGAGDHVPAGGDHVPASPAS